MDFELSPEQDALRAAARDLFAKLYAPETLRALWDGAAATEDAWPLMVEMGLPSLLVGEADGGMDGDEIDMMVALEEAGRAAVPEPLLEAAVATSLLRGTDVGADWLPRIAAGEVIATVRAPGEPYAVDADRASLLLYGSDGDMLATEEFSVTAVAGEDRGRRLFTVEPTGGDRVATAGDATVIGALATAALLNGVSLRLLELSLEHARVRRQFGAPIGAFQAVKHKLASVFATLESSKAATRYAAYTASQALPDRALAASVAKVHAVEAEAIANTEALQVHAGIGFTWEHDLHIWLKRGRALEQLYGSAREHRTRIAAAVLDGTGGT